MLLTQVPRFARAECSRCVRGFAALCLFNTRRQAHVLLAGHSSSLRGLTFELSWRHAVAAQLERGVRRRSAAGAKSSTPNLSLVLPVDINSAKVVMHRTRITAGGSFENERFSELFINM